MSTPTSRLAIEGNQKLTSRASRGVILLARWRRPGLPDCCLSLSAFPFTILPLTSTRSSATDIVDSGCMHLHAGIFF